MLHAAAFAKIERSRASHANDFRFISVRTEFQYRLFDLVLFRGTSRYWNRQHLHDRPAKRLGLAAHSPIQKPFDFPLFNIAALSSQYLSGIHEGLFLHFSYSKRTTQRHLVSASNFTSVKQRV